MTAAIITAQDVSIGHDGRVLLRGLDFAVRRGEVFVVLGGSGCGKSTLLRHMIGLEQPMHGTLALADGMSMHGGQGGAPSFGVMFQSGALLGSFTVGENLALPLHQWTALPDAAIGALVRAKLRLVGLGDAEDKLPAELSGGMKKRAAIARAMVLEPTLLFLDEPSAGLDPVSADALDALLLSLNATLGMTLVMVTHDLDSIFKVGSRCIMLDREAAGIIAEGDPRELRDSATDPRVHDFFHRSHRSAP